ncbi:MAG: arginine N-succinyltransferase [Gammaproteobacteria bacterium]|nr:arginine N-succinyltransferase [Gammaproteobacteria bacterium]
MTELADTTQVPVVKKGLSGFKIFGIVLLAMLVALVIAFFAIKYYFFPGDFNPVELNAKEQQALVSKLKVLGLGDLAVGDDIAVTNGAQPGKALKPEAYSESDEDREVSFSQREVNALVANNTDMAERVAIDLSDDLISAKMLLPMDEDMPLIGGKTLKFKAGLGLSYEKERAVVVLKGISVMGVPIPNAWLGGIKNIDLIQEFGGKQGFWKAFAEGIDYLNVKEGTLTIKLKE